jgi:TRAP transporter 4TM/12TM fusion protein
LRCEAWTGAGQAPVPILFQTNDGTAMTDTSTTDRSRLIVDCVYYAAALSFFAYIFHYYGTGAGGSILLALTLVPITFVLFTLQALRENDLYPQLPRPANYVIAAVFSAISLYVSYYMTTEYEDLGTSRAGMWNTADLVWGGLMTLLIIEYSRKRHMPLFILNIVLVLYAVYGYAVPGMFYHAGLSWERVVSASSIEMATGIFSNLPQIALTVVGSFLLVLSLLRGYGCIDSLVRATKRIAVRSPHALPQSAVIGSMCVGTVSGSGAANSITVGSATIPAMIGAGMPRATAAAIESASSLGGQFMPPVMGISAFLMAEFLGKDYFDVVARGWVPALIYYITVATSVYLLALRYRTRLVVGLFEGMEWRDYVNLGAFAVVVSSLIFLMAAYGLAPMFAALYVFIWVGVAVFAINLVPLLRPGRWSLKQFIAPLKGFLDAYTEMIADLTLLLATLSIMTGALVITGVPTKLGSLLVEAAGVNLAAMVAMSFIFGAILGTGLPPAPTYILVAIVIAPPMIQVGVNPWVVHFFAFFLGVFGELTPPTSLVAAITAKIANASFYQTLNRALQICVSLFTLMAGVFVRPELVIEPGLGQLKGALLILIATLGLTFAMQARFLPAKSVDRSLRVALGAISLVVLLYPNEAVAAVAALPVVAAVGYWLLRCRPTEEKERFPAEAAVVTARGPDGAARPREASA